MTTTPTEAMIEADRLAYESARQEAHDAPHGDDGSDAWARWANEALLAKQRLDELEGRIVANPAAALSVAEGRKEQSDTNAHLIAAAPDLYSAVERMVRQADEFAQSFGLDRVFETEDSLIAEGRAALARARGEKK